MILSACPISTSDVPRIVAHVARVPDPILSLVDSGALHSAIQADLVRHMPWLPSMESLIGADTQPIRVLGTLPLTVRYQHRVVEIPAARILERPVCPLILGADWIGLSGATIKADASGKLTVRFEEHETFETPEDTVAECPNEEAPLVNITANNEPAIQPDELLTEPNFLASITLQEIDNRLREADHCLKVAEKTIIPPEAIVFIPTSAPSVHEGPWEVKRAHSAQPGREWILQGCIVQPEDGRLHLPVLNLSKQPLVWQPSQEIAIACPLLNEPVSLPMALTISDSSDSSDAIDSSPELVDGMKIGSKLTDEERRQVIELLQRYRHAFSIDSEPGLATDVEHEIDTGDARPVHMPPYRVSPGEREIIQKQVEDMLDRGIISPSDSPWASPVVMVRKRCGALRFCVDYRRLNSVTRRNVYPLPRTDDVLERLGGARYFSSIDLTSGYWQIPVKEEDKAKTAFVTPDGLFQFNRMPFGLSNAPATFQALMDRVLARLKWNMCLVYLDDVLVFGRNFREHQERLEAVLFALSGAGLKLNPSKCSFAVSEIVHLGHLLDTDGIRPDPMKLAAVARFKLPTNVSSLRSFLGLISYYRRFVANFAQIASPLYALLKKDAEWKWGAREWGAFELLRTALAESTTLAHDDTDGALVLRTDASGLGLGAALAVVRDGVERPITFISRSLSPAEKNYDGNELECLGLVWALDKLRSSLYGRHFKVLTDSRALRWLFEKKDVRGRLSRWILALQEYDFEIEHIKGKTNVVADALSRSPMNVTETTDPTSRLLCAMTSSKAFKPHELAPLQQGDSSLHAVRVELRRAQEDETGGKQPPADFVLHRGIIYRRNNRAGRRFLLVVPSILRRDILESCHDDPTAGHLGYNSTFARVSERYWWPGLRKSVRVYCRSCRSCQFNKPITGTPAGHLQSIPPPAHPFHTIGMDHLGPFKSTQRGNQHCLVSIDYLSRWVEIIPVPDTKAKSVCAYLTEQFLPRHGAPIHIITDLGPAFISEEFAATVDHLGSRHTMASGEHPQTNGLVERMNRTLVSAIKSFINERQDNWDLAISSAQLCINTSRQDTTQMTPFELVYGRPAVLPHETAFPWPPEDPEPSCAFVQRLTNQREAARQLIVRRQERSRRRHDAGRKQLPQLQPGSLVLVARRLRTKGKTRKLLPKFVGPFQIVKQVCPVTYLVEDLPALRRRRMYRRFNAHVGQIRPFHVREENDWRPEDATDAEADFESDQEELNADTSGSVEAPPYEPEPIPEIAAVETPTPTPVRATRTGRISKPPGWLGDYVSE